ncbi:Maf family protein [Saccharibacillus alkalitolerans]|uniref:dTTP/UTP pyrophosphatase n=1 Tax=Saccharibacillus alkalitolerans TaxID=2705290 RepID=A0ABX0FD05_9BACL|nr:Maf family protein [Saccharibacillus alkalitolerans]NGZ77523.1 septum formation inhibitor Maf [Saccharibacillus alkalitolerans]
MNHSSNDRKTRQIILASSSPRRRELLASLGADFTVEPSGASEEVPGDWTPERIVEDLALRKAEWVMERRARSEGVIVGSDTIVVLDGAVLGKPKDAADAVRMLSLLSGREHRVYTGAACIDAASGRAEVSHRFTNVRMKELSERRIEDYVKSGEPMDKAGAYAIQGLGALLVESIEGDYFTVVGLPLALLGEMLEGFGVNLLPSNP